MDDGDSHPVRARPDGEGCCGPDGRRPHVLVLGGGFGGLHAVKTLARAQVAVTIADAHNYHLFQPLLYEVATAALSAGEIAMPLRRIFRHRKNVTVLMAQATAIDLARQTVRFTDDELAYDYLIVATGSTHSYFGHDEWEPLAPGLKTIDDAVEIRRRVLIAFEAAEREPDPELRRAWLTFVIVGGGTTGVELAGALAEVARRTLAEDFRCSDPKAARIVLAEGKDRVLPTYAPESSARAMRKLIRLGVEVHASSNVTNLLPGRVMLGGEVLRAQTILWSAGVKASTLGATLGVPLDRAGRVRVAPDLGVPGHPEVFVVGDLAALTDDGKPVPGVAPAAIQEGRHAARNVLRALDGKPSLPFHYRDKGSLATIGRAAAVAEIGPVKVNGFVAWVLWLVVHLLYLIGFRNRLAVLSGWAWKYLTWERGARLITGEREPLQLRLERPREPPALPRHADEPPGLSP